MTVAKNRFPLWWQFREKMDAIMARQHRWIFAAIVVAAIVLWLLEWFMGQDPILRRSVLK